LSYVASILQPGETVRAMGRIHWIIYGRAALLGIVALAVFFYAGALDGSLGRVATLIGWFLLALAALAFLHASFTRWITELAVTNHRVIYKQGFLARHTVEMNMDKVETVDVDQSIAGRLLGYGTIRVRGTGQGIENLRGISAPIELRNAITSR
jgi:uncharacterized membrane protein YdbT with pleckstrin-like domain